MFSQKILIFPFAYYLFLIFNLFSCAYGNEEISGTLLHDGLTREYVLHIPSSYDKSKSSPLILGLHGGGGVGKKMNKNTTKNTLNKAAEKEGFFIVYPEGIEKRWNDGRTKVHWPAHQRKVDDLGFLSALIDHLCSTYNLDKKRIYATGISNGGMMSYRLACELPEKIAAIASVTACLPIEFVTHQPSQPVSVLIINGTEDPLMPFNGGEIRVRKKSLGKVLSTLETVHFWISRNSCQEKPETIIAPNTNKFDRATVKIDRYKEGKSKTTVVLYTIEGGGHTWPGGKQYLPRAFIGGTCRDINASEIIVAFFKEHAKP